VDAEWVGIAGVAGTLIGTLGTNWIGSRQLRAQLAAQQVEADRQRRFDDAKEHRESRREAYEKFLDAGHRLELLFEGDPTWDEATPQLHDLHKIGATVSVVGPGSVAAAADEVMNAVARQMFRNGEARSLPGETITGSLRDFAVAARVALEDDGQQPPGQE
jgi:hypothetical protein